MLTLPELALDVLGSVSEEIDHLVKAYLLALYTGLYIYTLRFDTTSGCVGVK